MVRNGSVEIVHRERPDVDGVVSLGGGGGEGGSKEIVITTERKNSDVDGVVGGIKQNVITTVRKKKSNKRTDAVAEIEEEKREAVVSIEDGFLHQEPLSLFGSDIMLMILNFLDAKGIALCLLVSHGWHEVASSDSLWTSRCQELWLGKAHIPRVSQVRRISRLAAYSFSVMDGRRTRIVKEDLCDHAWEFRFKKEASDYWLNLDPSWTGTGPPMKRYFHPDGTLSADPGDLVWGAHECNYSIVTSFVSDGKIREHYVRINRWPHMTISRNLDWSWEMGNCLHLYSSIPDADKEGGTGPLFPVCKQELQMREVEKSIYHLFLVDGGDEQKYFCEENGVLFVGSEANKQRYSNSKPQTLIWTVKAFIA